MHDARVGILFSGGLDCLCLAALADRFLPEGEAIDLLNVGFENPRSVKAKAAEEALALKRLKKKQGVAESSFSGSADDDEVSDKVKTAKPDTRFNVPDRTTGYESLAELRKISPRRHWNFVEVNVPFEEATAQRSEILERIAPLETVMDLVKLARFCVSLVHSLNAVRRDKITYTVYASVGRALQWHFGSRRAESDLSRMSRAS